MKIPKRMAQHRISARANRHWVSNQNSRIDSAILEHVTTMGPSHIDPIQEATQQFNTILLHANWNTRTRQNRDGNTRTTLAGILFVSL